MNVIVEPSFLRMTEPDQEDLKSSDIQKCHVTPSAARMLSEEMIRKVASHSKSLSKNCVMLTNANEVLMKDGIHGKIAPVGTGFGTGRHTAHIRLKKSLDFQQKLSLQQ